MNDSTDRTAHAQLVRTVKAALPALELMSFEEVVDELIFLAIDACEPEGRVKAIGRALTKWASEDDIAHSDGAEDRATESGRADTPR